MYDIVWDPETGGILLKEAASEGLKSAIRPVFHEELDLLGFQEKWRYPRVREPLLWATTVGRLYFYRGECVAEAKGGSFFQAPTIRYFREDLELTPVDVPAMLAKNAALMRSLTQEAIGFIRQSYDRERPRADIAAVAFSGGKDSLTLLDLVQRALRPDEYVVVFNDTQMEISPTYEAVEKAKKRWPHLRFYTSRCHKPPEQTWREFGPPSRIHRWCCSVHKSVPNLLLLRQLAGNPAARVLVFDGIRGEESPARAAYGRITPGGKHGTQVNVSPILKWNSGEIFLYILRRDIFFNGAYRYGLVRVGCSVCPMASDWSESIYWLKYYNDCKKLINVLHDYNLNNNYDNFNYRDNFSWNNAWKSRAGGRGIQGNVKIIETIRDNVIEFLVRNPTENWLEWAKILGRLHFTGNGSGVISGKSFLWSFKHNLNNNILKITINGIKSANRFQISHLRGIAQKVAYCIHCKTCEIECPTGAISINDKVNVNIENCKHCYNCLEFESKGCLAGKSLQISKEGNIVKGINRYQGFGMKTEWLKEFFDDPDNWWKENNIGNRQFEAMRVWLRECEIIENNKLSEMGHTLKNIGIENIIFWHIIWANLARNSILIKWYLSSVQWGEKLSKSELIELMGDDLSYRSRENAVNALFYLFKNTQLGNKLLLGKVYTKDNKVKYLEKRGPQKNFDKIAILYSIYRYAELIERYDLSLNEFYNNPKEGPYYLFGVNKNDLKEIVLGLSVSYNNLISVEFVKDLDNIYVYDNIRSIDILKNL